MECTDLFIWRSEWFLRPYREHLPMLRRHFEQMHHRTWCLKRKWDANHPNYLQLPGDDIFKVGRVIPYGSLDKMLRMSLRRMMQEWNHGYPFPEIGHDGTRKIPIKAFILSGDQMFSNERSIFCRFLALALGAQNGDDDWLHERLDIPLHDRPKMTMLRDMMRIERLRGLNPSNTRIDEEYIGELLTLYKGTRQLPMDGWNFAPLVNFMRGYGLSI